MSTATIETTGLKLTCHAKAMLDAVTLAGSVVKATTPSLIMQNVKLAVAEDGTATVSATDGEVQIRVGVDGVESSGAGAILLPPEKVAKILKKSEGESVSFEVDGSEILIVDGRSKFRLPWMDPAMFPEVDPMDMDDCHDVQAEDLATAIKRTAYAADEKGTRGAVLAGIFVDIKESRIVLAGLDGLRMARMIIPAAIVGRGGALVSGRPAVPVKAMKLVERVCERDRPVNLAITPRSLNVRSGAVELTCRLLEGQYPRFEPKLDEKPRVVIAFEPGDILDAVERASVTCSEESRGVWFKFTPGQLSLSSRASERGASNVVIDAAHEGEEVSVILHHVHVADAVKHFDSGPVEMGISADEDRVQFRGPNNYTCMVSCQAKVLPK